MFGSDHLGKQRVGWLGWWEKEIPVLAIITPRSLDGYQPEMWDPCYAGQLRRRDFHCMQRFMGLIDLVGDLWSGPNITVFNKSSYIYTYTHSIYIYNIYSIHVYFLLMEIEKWCQKWCWRWRDDDFIFLRNLQSGTIKLENNLSKMIASYQTAIQNPSDIPTLYNKWIHRM